MTPLHREPHAATTVPATHPAQRYVIRRLRHLVPEHPISWLEAERIAAAQASGLLTMAHRADLDPVQFIVTLPVIRVAKESPLPLVHTSYWDGEASQWVIVISDTLGPDDQRLSIVREFKHILDRGHESRLYDARYPHGNVQAEMAEEHFASSVLLPARRVRAAAKDGAATTASLARTFGVTPARAELRLSDLDLHL